MESYKMWIEGKWVDADSGKTFLTHNPATGEVVAEVPLAGASDVDKAVAAARKAFPAWSRRTQASSLTAGCVAGPALFIPRSWPTARSPCI